MNKITSIEYVNALIAAGVEECTTLEYKSNINKNKICIRCFQYYKVSL